MAKKTKTAETVEQKIERLRDAYNKARAANQLVVADMNAIEAKKSKVLHPLDRQCSRELIAHHRAENKADQVTFRIKKAKLRKIEKEQTEALNNSSRRKMAAQKKTKKKFEAAKKVAGRKFDAPLAKLQRQQTLHNARATRLENEIFRLSNAERMPPLTGSFIAYKKVDSNGRGHALVKLQIPPRAKRLCHDKRAFKARVSSAKVLEMNLLNTGEVITKGYAFHDSNFAYEVGKVVRPKGRPFDSGKTVCSSGIHCFMRKQDARSY